MIPVTVNRRDVNGKIVCVFVTTFVMYNYVSNVYYLIFTVSLIEYCLATSLCCFAYI